MHFIWSKGLHICMAVTFVTLRLIKQTAALWNTVYPRNVRTVFALLCFVVVIHWLLFPYPSGLLHWHCGNLTIAPVPAKQPWWIWINTSCEFIMNDCITTTKQSTTKPCAYFLGYTVYMCSRTILGRLWLIASLAPSNCATRFSYLSVLCCITVTVWRKGGPHLVL